MLDTANYDCHLVFLNVNAILMKLCFLFQTPKQSCVFSQILSAFWIKIKSLFPIWLRIYFWVLWREYTGDVISRLKRERLCHQGLRG